MRYFKGRIPMKEARYLIWAVRKDGKERCISNIGDCRASWRKPPRGISCMELSILAPENWIEISKEEAFLELL